MNCQSIKNKRCELQATTEYIKPDIIIGNDSWLAPEYTNSEIFTEGFNSMVYRKDRNKMVVAFSYQEGTDTQLAKSTKEAPIAR